MTPILLLGAGRMGSALIAGWEAAGAIAPAELMIREPNPGADIVAQSMTLNPPDDDGPGGNDLALLEVERLTKTVSNTRVEQSAEKCSTRRDQATF